MRTGAKLGMVVAAGALAVAVPAAAHPGKGNPNHPSTSHKCSTHNVAYIAHGTVPTGGWTATQTGTPTGTWDGTISLTTKSTNHHAKGATTFTLMNTKVRLGKGVPSPSPTTSGDRVTVLGKIAVNPKHASACTGGITGPTAGTITIRNVEVLAPKK